MHLVMTIVADSVDLIEICGGGGCIGGGGVFEGRWRDVFLRFPTAGVEEII